MIPLRDNIPTRRLPLITLGLIASNILVFLNQYLFDPSGPGRLFCLYALVPSPLPPCEPFVPSPLPISVTIFTSMFLHGGLFHVGGNMLYLWIFGNNVEDSMGRLRFILFYLLSGVAAALAQLYLAPGARAPMVGASGAISGVLGAYLLLYPRARVVTLITFGWFIRLVEVPALFFLGFWIALQFLNGLLAFGFPGSEVAWFAHIGGFFVGLLLIGLFKRREVRWGWRRGPWS